MWNKFVEIIQDSSYRRLGVALIISVILHTWMFGGLHLSLPIHKKEMHEIEARIQMPKATVKKIEPPKPKPEVIKPEIKKPAEPPKVEKVVETPTPDSAEAMSLEPEDIPQPIETPPERLPQTEPQAEPQPLDAGLVINENAYQYVETYFDVHTKIDGPTEGHAKIIFSLVDNQHYQLNFLVEAEGLAAVFLPNLLQTSDGLLTKTGLQPLNYLYQYGKKTDKTRKAVFDWQANTLQLTINKGVKTEPLLEGAQDMLSFMYQFMYVAPLQEMQLNITNGKKLRIYNYVFEGEENVNSPLGEVKAIHIAHSGVDLDEKTELWLAIDYQYIPIKIRKTEKEGKVYEFVATRIVTTRPTIDQVQENK